jgi:hypothetical protein
MKNGIPYKQYYALLEWKDEHFDEWLYYSSHNGVERLCECTVEQLNQLISNYLKQNNDE